MNSDSTSLENELRGLKPAAFDDALLSRLEACAEGTIADLSTAELLLERKLRATAPAAISAEMMASFESMVRDIPFPVNEKIVLFPKGSNHGRTKHRYPWAAAAAVALIGGVSALFLPGTVKAPAQADVRQPSAVSPVKAENVVPTAYKSGLSEARDEGVLWNSKTKPQRVVRVVYMDRVTVRNPDGKMMEVEQPRVEYVLVPEKID